MDYTKEIIDILGYILIFVAIDYKRKDRSKIKAFSIDRLVIIIMVIAAVLMIKY